MTQDSISSDDTISNYNRNITRVKDMERITDASMTNRRNSFTATLGIETYRTMSSLLWYITDGP